MFLKGWQKKWVIRADSFLKSFALFCLEIYKNFLSNLLGSGGSCRFYPSCSEYAALTYKKYSFLKASRLILFRLLSCHPFGPKWRDD